MYLWRIIPFVCAANIIVEAKWYHHQKRETVSNICDPVYNNTNKIQCYCVRDKREAEIIRTADCYPIVDGLAPEDKNWDAFEFLKNVNILTLTNTRGIALKYIPNNVFKYTEALIKLDIKYATIERIKSFAFANLSSIEEITLRDNQIEMLETNAFAHHRDLKTISLDTNNIVEINRNVFIDLPSIEKLFLTSNKITTIHDRAFIHLDNLKELEMDRNKLFSLNSETFSGLKKLQKLDLSSNNLEVIGDNTFLPLINLKSLNLDSNRIQMLDEKAFNGLSQLQSLSLAHNKLSNIEDGKIFQALESLTILSLRANQIIEIKTEVMAPILKNFYGVSSNFDVEENNFPCDCRLEWFTSLMNKTQNSQLKIALENLKCLPDSQLRETWKKLEEADKNNGQAFEDDQPAQNTDYEYYDDTQLNGKLFYIDIRDLINCTNVTSKDVAEIIPETTVTTHKPTTIKMVETTKVLTTKAMSSPIVTSKYTTVTPVLVTEFKNNKVTNQGLLDLSLDDTTIKTSDATKGLKSDIENEIRSDKKQTSYTTSRLATVSANPIDHKNAFDHEMASDEARPDKLKAHRSIQEEHSHSFKTNNAQRNIYSITVFTPLILLCLRYFLCITIN